MAQTSLLPWTATYNNAGQTPWTDSGTTPNTVRDERPPPKHVKPDSDGWRAPSTYFRIIEEGMVTTFNLSSSTGWPYYSGGKYYWNWCTFQGAYGDSYFYDAIPSPTMGLENKAVINALNKLKSLGTEEEFSVDLATAFGEREQTAKLIATSLMRIVGGVRAAMRLDPRGVARALRCAVLRNPKKYAGTPFQLWLEYQYGWKPLLSDAYNALNVLAYQELERGKVTARVIATSEEKDLTTRRFFESVGSGERIYLTKTRRIHHKCKVRLDYVRNDTPAVDDLEKVGITNPLLVAWELVPFSFVVDWFVPIGDYLSSLDAALGWSLRGGTSTTTTEVYNTLSVDGLGDFRSPPWPISGGATVEGNSRQFKTARTVFTSSPLPHLPYWKPKASGLHVANGIALLASVFTGGGSHAR